MLASISSLVFLDIHLLAKGFFSEPQKIEIKKRPAAIKEDSGVNFEENLNVKDFTIISKSSDDYFRKDSPVEVSCAIENNSNLPVENFKSLIRSNKGEISSQITEKLEPNETITLKGVWTPETSGIVYLACRTDVDAQIPEASENDNREFAAIYALPAK